ncbi:hypothetical protein [Bacillus thuringiensis]|uniref:hypothetical protein n=1 Tax=Bacillus thuringiensis TaxID=1428 RepID=UPI002079C5F9|nr:hypothetical protein [Bacillus thuringiensis]USL16432.1 hypothetical protein LIT28_29125 [Bacillus thuringiensis]
MGTSMVVNRYYKQEEQTENILPKLIEKKVKVEINSNEKKYIPIELGINKYELRTIFIENTANNDYECTIFDKQKDGQIQYSSIKEKRTYDIINIPCDDKDQTNSCHLFIENFSNVPSLYTVVLKVTTLI